MKRYLIRSEDLSQSAQYPSRDPGEAQEQAKRHAMALGITGPYQVKYVGKWRGPDDPEEFSVKSSRSSMVDLGP